MPYKDKAKNDACRKAWRLAHKEQEKAYSVEWRKRNLEKARKRYRKNYLANIDRRRETNKLWMREYLKNRTDEQRRKDIERTKEWKRNHPGYHNKKTLESYHSNPLPCLIRIMVARMIKVADIPKTSRSYKYIGCTPDFLRGWLQAGFRDGMTWDNYGKVWVVDHIKPLVSFELKEHPERIFEASHYSNLQPLLVEENLRKGFRIA